MVGWGDNTAGAATGAPTHNPPNLQNNSTGVVMVSGRPLKSVTAICAGANHGLALRNDGTVVGWGFNYYGQAVGSASVSPDTTNGLVTVGGHVLTNVIAIAAGQDHSLALKGDGTLAAWGKIDSLPHLTNIVAIAGGGRYDSALALKRDGTVASLSARGSVPAGLSNITAIAAGGGDYWPPLALKSDGTVVVWRGAAIADGGDDAAPPPGLSNVVAIAAGHNHNLALKRDGTVLGWGSNGAGQATGVPTTNDRYTSSGPVRLDGQILSNIVAVAAANEFSLALKHDGTVVAWGRNWFHQTDVPGGLANVTAIAAGRDFCLAITTNSSPLGLNR